MVEVKSKKRKIEIKLSEEVYQTVREKAEAQLISVTDVVRMALAAYIK